MCLNVHSIVAQKIKSSLSVLIVYNHTFLKMYFFPEILTNSQSMSKFNNNIETLSLVLCLHLAESVLQCTTQHCALCEFQRALYAGQFPGQFPGVCKHR